MTGVLTAEITEAEAGDHHFTGFGPMLINPNLRMQWYSTEAGVAGIRVWAPRRGELSPEISFDGAANPEEFGVLSRVFLQRSRFTPGPAETRIMTDLSVLIEPDMVCKEPKLRLPRAASADLGGARELTSLLPHAPNALDWTRFCSCLESPDEVVWTQTTHASVINPWHVGPGGDVTDVPAVDEVELVSIPQGLDAARVAFARQGACNVASGLPRAQLSALQGYYNALIDAGLLRLGDVQSHRLWSHNDPVTRNLQLRLWPLIAELVGSPIKPSYTYLVQYLPGADLPVHRDRSQCRYTATFLLDGPTDAEGRSRWPLLFHVDAAEPMALHQAIGDVAVFRGIEIAHSRPVLASNARSMTALLHYVDADFTRPLD